MLLKCCTQYASKFGKVSSGHRTGKGQFLFQSQRMTIPNNAQTISQLHSFHIYVYGDCSHEIRRHLLLGRKAMTNLDSVLKSKDINLPTKVHIVKVFVFPVVMYRCQSRTTKKADHHRIDAFKLWCCSRLLRIPWTVRRSNQ